MWRRRAGDAAGSQHPGQRRLVSAAVPILGRDATVRAVGPPARLRPRAPSPTRPTDEAGFAFMWHSHNEREITTNNIFPGGMMMMMLVDSAGIRDRRVQLTTEDTEENRQCDSTIPKRP